MTKHAAILSLKVSIAASVRRSGDPSPCFSCLERMYDQGMNPGEQGGTGRTAAEGGLSSVPLNRPKPDRRPPEHDRVCWAAAIGGARHLIPLESWETAELLAAQRLRDGSQHCICGRRKGQQRGRRRR